MPVSDTPVANGRLTVGLVVGSQAAPESGAAHCGVRDYAVCLAQALREAGLDASVMAPASWGPRDGIGFFRSLRAARLDIVHLQYPSISHRHSLLPHLLGPAGAGRRCVVTLHEHSALPRVQRMANALFRATADELIFTTQHEARNFGVAHGPVIPIGSNVPVHAGAPDRDKTVLYFGQIRPGKGIEAFIALAALSAAAGEPWRFAILGSTPPRWREYGQALRAQAPAAMDWKEDLPFSAVARAMATAMAAVLPFPDGASLRRGSMLASLSNGLPVIAPFGPATTPELRTVLLPADTPEAALAQLRALRDAPVLARQRAAAGRTLVHGFGWPAIAEAHVALYQRLLAMGPTDPPAARRAHSGRTGGRSRSRE